MCLWSTAFMGACHGGPGPPLAPDKLHPCVNVFARLMNDTLQHLITLSLFLHVCLHNESSSFWLIAKNWWKITYRASGYSWKISGPVSWLCCRLVVLMWYFMSFRSSATYTKKLQPFEYCCRQRCFLLFRSCTHTCIQMSCNIASSAVKINILYAWCTHTYTFSCYRLQLLHPCNSRYNTNTMRTVRCIRQHPQCAKSASVDDL